MQCISCIHTYEEALEENDTKRFGKIREERSSWWVYTTKVFYR